MSQHTRPSRPSSSLHHQEKFLRKKAFITNQYINRRLLYHPLLHENTGSISNLDHIKYAQPVLRHIKGTRRRLKKLNQRNYSHTLPRPKQFPTTKTPSLCFFFLYYVPPMPPVAGLCSPLLLDVDALPPSLAD